MSKPLRIQIIGHAACVLISVFFPCLTFAEDTSFSAYLKTCQFYHTGGSRKEAARRFSEISNKWPKSREGVTSAKLSGHLSAMVKEDAGIEEIKTEAKEDEQGRIHLLIYELRDVSEQSSLVPGKTNVLHYPRTQNSAAMALRKIGKPAVPYLLRLLEDERPTRSFSGALNGAYILRYNDVALQIIEGISGRRFDHQTARGAYFSNAPKDLREKITLDVQNWWAKNKIKTEFGWLRESLLETGIGAMWDRLASAHRLIELDATAAVEFFRERLTAEPDNPHILRLLQKAESKIRETQ